MKYIIFDTETTDLKGEVIQLSYMVVDEKYNIVDFNSFYCDTTAKITQGAFNVHGISHELLEVLSEGKFLEDYLLKDPKKRSIFIDSTGLVFIGYNVKFDIDRLNQSLLPTGKSLTSMIEATSLSGLNSSFSYSYDLMKATREYLRVPKNVKLSQATNLITKRKNPDLDVELLYSIYKDQFNLKSVGGHYHDASYDVFCTYLLLLSINQ